MQLLGLTVTLDLAVTLFCFWLIFYAGFRYIRIGRSFRSALDWAVDAFGLINQGLIVPILIATVLVPLLGIMLPAYAQVADIPVWIAFLLPLTIVDYAYYWNHRWLHRKSVWPIHRLHHSARHLDILITSRNSLLAPIFIVYIWIHALFLFVLKSPEAYLLGVALSSSLDLWRHSGIRTHKSLFWIRHFLITPEEHNLHHSQQETAINLGANLSFWDRLHGTYAIAEGKPTGRYGESFNRSSLLRLFIFPWGKQP